MQIPVWDDLADNTKHSSEKYSFLWRFDPIPGQYLTFRGFTRSTPFYLSYFYSVSRLRMSGVIHPLFHYVCMTCTRTSLLPLLLFSTLTEGFPCFFLSCKANARVYLAKTGHGTHSSLIVLFHVLCCSIYCFVSIVLFMYCLCVKVY